jgi:hypothetical protein
MAGFFTYFVIMGQNGFLPQDLFFLRKLWDKHSTLLGDSYGQEWECLIFDHVTLKSHLKLHNSHVTLVQDMFSLNFGQLNNIQQHTGT